MRRATSTLWVFRSRTVFMTPRRVAAALMSSFIVSMLFAGLQGEPARIEGDSLAHRGDLLLPPSPKGDDDHLDQHGRKARTLTYAHNSAHSHALQVAQFKGRGYGCPESSGPLWLKTQAVYRPLGC